MSKNRYISIKTKQNVLNNQKNKCANTPALNMFGYQCILWKYEEGNFDQSGYQFDHIVEHMFGTDNKINNVNNIQAICPNCHAVKTKQFTKNKKRLTSVQIMNGCEIMDES